MSDKLLKTVERYYTGKVVEHGNTSKGVDWNTKDSQFLRFEKLAGLLPSDQKFSLLDYGCGTGAFIDFLKERGSDFSYHGFDISEEMIKVARNSHIGSRSQFSIECPQFNFDYVIASGIFNIRFAFSEQDWIDYIHHTLDTLNEKGEKGFAFNILSLYSDVEKRRADLFYGDPLYFFDLCKKKYSRFVSLIHDYPLYEFSILVRKDV